MEWEYILLGLEYVRGVKVNEISREEYNKGQERTHERIDKINDSSIGIAKSVQHMDVMITKMHDIVYGNGRDGLATKIGKAYTQLTIHFSLIMLCLGGILTIAYFIIRNILK